jgi:tetratricopeptide (TPR) repeat protein
MPRRFYRNPDRVATEGTSRGSMKSLAALVILSFVCSCTRVAPLSPRALALNREGAAALAAGRLETAEARLALALEYSQRFTEAWVNLGLVELERGSFARARRDFLQARRLDPDLPAPHHALGLLAEREGDFASAEAGYRAALKVDPGFAPARANLARRLFERGAFEEAREQFLRLTQVAPELPEAWAGLCESLLRLERVDDASRLVAQARVRWGPRPAWTILGARVSLRRGDFDQAIDDLEPISHARDPRQRAAALAWLAIARLAKGDVAVARAAAEQALDLEPGAAVALYARAAARAAVDSVSKR